MASKSITHRLSTQWLLPFKIFVSALYTAFVLGMIYVFLSDTSRWWTLFNIGSFGYIFYLLFTMLATLRTTSFDDEFLYVQYKGNEVQIPLANVKEVEIKTVGGVYKVHLLFKDIVGDHFYFKPSLLYPLNYRSKDDLVDLLREKIEKAKQRRQETPINALTS